MQDTHFSDTGEKCTDVDASACEIADNDNKNVDDNHSHINDDNDNIDVDDHNEAGANDDSSIQGDDTKNDISDPISTRKSGRDRRIPDRYGVYLSHQQNVTHPSDMRERVELLISLVDIFPENKNVIFDAIMKLLI